MRAVTWQRDRPAREENEMRMHRPVIHQPRARLVRTAMIAGTATMMSMVIWRRHGIKGLDRFASPPQAEPPPGGITADQLDRLSRLGELRKTEVLSPEEFEVQKAQILGSAP